MVQELREAGETRTEADYTCSVEGGFWISAKTWNPHPLSIIIVELLQRKGPTTDVELHEMVKEIRGEMGFSAVNTALMRLELQGLVHVSSLARGKRRIELIKKDREGA